MLRSVEIRRNTTDLSKPGKHCLTIGTFDMYTSKIPRPLSRIRKGYLPEQVENRNAQRKDVARGTPALTDEVLSWDVELRALSDGNRLMFACDSEIDQDWRLAGAGKNIARLYIIVNDILFV